MLFRNGEDRMNLMQMKKFIGEGLSKEHLKKMESYSYEQLAILIPTSNETAYKQWGSWPLFVRQEKMKL